MKFEASWQLFVFTFVISFSVAFVCQSIRRGRYAMPKAVAATKAVGFVVEGFCPTTVTSSVSPIQARYLVFIAVVIGAALWLTLTNGEPFQSRGMNVLEATIEDQSVG